MNLDHLISHNHYRNVNSRDQIKTAKLLFNGRDRIPSRKACYFRLTQKYQHHSGSNMCLNSYENTGDSIGTNDRLSYNSPTFYMYSFALNPEAYQPSGSCNFSNVDRINLHLELADSLQLGSTSTTIDRNCRVYAVSYNVLRLMSGMGGLAYN